jgi:hypothetical protein
MPARGCNPEFAGPDKGSRERYLRVYYKTAPFHFLPLFILPPPQFAPLFDSACNFSTYNDWLATTTWGWSIMTFLLTYLHFHLIFNTFTHSLYFFTSYTSPLPPNFYFLNPPYSSPPLYLTLPAIPLPIQTGLHFRNTP